MWELDHKESWVSKNWCFWTVVLDKTLESPLDSKEIQPVHPKGDQFWIFIGRTDAEAPILCSPDAKNWLIRKDPDAGKDWRQEEKGMTEDGMVGWHHRLNEHDCEQAPCVGDGQGGLVCCSQGGSQRVGHNWATELNWWQSKVRIRSDVKQRAIVGWSTARSHLDVRTRSFCSNTTVMAVWWEFWKTDGILIYKNRKTEYLSIHLGSSYDVHIYYIRD